MTHPTSTSTSVGSASESPSARRCDRCGRSAVKWEERDAFTAWSGPAGQWAYPCTRTFTLCKRCLLWTEGIEALGSVLFFVGIALLFSYFFNWPRLLWSWDPNAPMGVQGGKLVFGTMGTGALLFLAFGTRRWLDNAALDERETPDVPGWRVIAVLEEQYGGVVRSAEVPASQGVPRVDTWSAATLPVAEVSQDTSLVSQLKAELRAWLVRDATREYERAHNAWWSRENLVMAVLKDRVQTGAEPFALFPAAQAAIDELVAEGSITGTDTGYRAAATSREARATPALRGSSAPRPCFLCGGTCEPTAVEMLVRTGRALGTRTIGTERVGNAVLSTTQTSYGAVEDTVVHLCRGCWVDQRQLLRSAMIALALGLPTAMILGAFGSLYGVETWYIAFLSLAVILGGGFGLLAVALKRIRAAHPMNQIEPRVIALRNTREEASGFEIVSTTWPPPRPRWGD